MHSQHILDFFPFFRSIFESSLFDTFAIYIASFTKIHQKMIEIPLKNIRWKFSIRKRRFTREARDPRRMRSIVVSFRNGAKCRRHNSEWLRTANYWATRPLAASLHHYCACIGALVWLFVGGVEGLTRQIMASSLIIRRIRRRIFFGHNYQSWITSRFPFLIVFKVHRYYKFLRIFILSTPIVERSISSLQTIIQNILITHTSHFPIHSYLQIQISTHSASRNASIPLNSLIKRRNPNLRISSNEQSLLSKYLSAIVPSLISRCNLNRQEEDRSQGVGSSEVIFEAESDNRRGGWTGTSKGKTRGSRRASRGRIVSLIVARDDTVYRCALTRRRREARPRDKQQEAPSHPPLRR